MFRHVGIVTNNSYRSKSFYEKYFGFKTIRYNTLDKDRMKQLFNADLDKMSYHKMSNGNVTLELYEFEYYKDIPYSFNHLAFTVKDIDKTYKNMLADEVRCITAPQKAPDSNCKLYFCHDYDGNLLEIVEEEK